MISVVRPSQGVIHVQDQKTANTNGGASVAGAQTRILNTVVKNTINGASLASNQVTLPAGTYRAWASAPGYATNAHRVILVNSTDTANLILGSSEYSDGTAGAAATNSIVYGEFTLTGTKALQLTHNTNRVQANGLGVPVNDGSVEVYAQLMIVKIG